MNVAKHLLASAAASIASALCFHAHAQVAWRTAVNFPADATEVERISAATDGELALVVRAADGTDRFELRLDGADGRTLATTALPNYCPAAEGVVGDARYTMERDAATRRFRLARRTVGAECELSRDAEVAFDIDGEAFGADEYRLSVAEPYYDAATGRVYVAGLADYNFDDRTSTYAFRQYLYAFDAATLAPVAQRIGDVQVLGPPPSFGGVLGVVDGAVLTVVTAPTYGTLLSAAGVMEGEANFEEAFYVSAGSYVSHLCLSASGTVAAVTQGASAGAQRLTLLNAAGGPGAFRSSDGRLAPEGYFLEADGSVVAYGELVSGGSGRTPLSRKGPLVGAIDAGGEEIVQWRPTDVDVDVLRGRVATDAPVAYVVVADAAGTIEVVRLGASVVSARKASADAPALRVWPNPVAAGQALRIRGAHASPEATAYVLYDVAGRVVAEGQSASGGEVALPVLPKGVYRLWVQSGGNATVVVE